jgi:hypothetical protein
MDKLTVILAVLALSVVLCRYPAPASAAGEPVPAEDVRRVRSLMVDLDNDESTAANIRQLQSLLRRGRALVRRYPDAENLYMVQHLMLEASRKLLMLGEPVRLRGGPVAHADTRHAEGREPGAHRRSAGGVRGALCG